MASFVRSECFIAHPIPLTFNHIHSVWVGWSTSEPAEALHTLTCNHTHSVWVGGFRYSPPHVVVGWWASEPVEALPTLTFQPHPLSLGRMDGKHRIIWNDTREGTLRCMTEMTCPATQCSATRCPATRRSTTLS